MNIQEQLQRDQKEAMRSGDRVRLDTIRLGLAALQSAQQALVQKAYDEAVAAAPVVRGEDGGVVPPEVSIDRKVPLTDAQMQETIAREVKKRREAIEIFRKGGREDLVSQQEAEVAILEGYLPRQLTADELRPLVGEVIAELGAAGAADLGRVMPALMQRLKGRADGRLINQIARELLAG